MRDAVLCIVASVGFLVSQIFSPEIAHTAVITLVNLDGAGEGFNDPGAPDAASAAGGNGGATLGAQRLVAFQRAMAIWGRYLSSPVEIRVDANFNPLTCTSSSATLGSAGTKSVHRDFAGAPLANTWYPQALANSRAGTDLSPGTNGSDIVAQFNSAIGTTCAFPLVWYYGLDSNPPSNALDFVSVVLHELGHGLGFQSFVDLTSGTKFIGFDDVFSGNLENHSTGKLYPQMTDAERVTASQSSGNLHWVGANVVAASGSLTAGVHPSGHVQMYAPTPQQLGSSVSHFDAAVAPNEMMEPFYSGPNHNVGLTLELFADLGWTTLSGFTDVDFDGDSKADVGIYRDGIWSIKRSSDGGTTNFNWGGASWTPVVADYDGDGIADIAVRNASNGLWSIVRSSDGGNTLIGWSAAADDIPVPADYDGDGKADLAVYNTASAGWSIIRSSDGGLTYRAWGGPSWVPVPADYDGDGKVDIAVRNGSNGLWSIVRSTDGGNTLFGWSAAANDIPVPADYDGDGKADFAVYNTATAGWSIIRSSDGGLTYKPWGGPAWEPVVADYDGDGKADIAVYNASNGLWSILRSSDGGNTLVGLGGAPQDIPLN
jgi:hypothetical protein